MALKIFPSQVEKLHVELHLVAASPVLQPIQDPLDGRGAFWLSAGPSSFMSSNSFVLLLYLMKESTELLKFIEYSSNLGKGQ